VRKILEIKKGHGKKVCVDQNTDLHPLLGGTTHPEKKKEGKGQNLPEAVNVKFSKPEI
jgi:hypothetical protein